MSTSTLEKQFAISSARGIVDELVFNMAKHERNPFTLEHVKTLLAGKTVGGYQLHDQNQILRLKDAWDELFRLVESGQPFLSKSSVLRLHGIVGEQEALEWGIFRSGPVTISGTSYQPPDALKLVVLFDQLIEAMSELDTPVDRGITLFVSCARNQFFWDCNKRMGQFLMNGVLLANGKHIVTIPVRDKEQYDQLLIHCYDTGDIAGISEFLKHHKVG